MRPAATTRPHIFFFIFTSCMSALFLVAVYNNSDKNSAKYEASQLAGVISKVVDYNRGFPIVLVNNKRIYIHAIPPEFTKYIQPGDSIVKLKGNYRIISYRKLGKCLEVIYWQYAIKNGYEQPAIIRHNTCE